MAIADVFARFFVKRLGNNPILGVTLIPRILHRGTAQVTGSPQVYNGEAPIGVVTLVTPSHLLFVSSGRLLFATPWRIVTEFSAIDSDEDAWVIEVNFPNLEFASIVVEPRHANEVKIFEEFIAASIQQLESR